MKIVLIGFMATGKTSVGRILAREMGLEFIDTDSLVESETGMSISRLFEERGEAFFRRVESRVVERVAARRGVVIATGGGAVLDPMNWQRLSRGGFTVALFASPAEIIRRTRSNRDRPLLEEAEPGSIEALLEKRLPCYRKADFRLETGERTPAGLAREIIRLVKAGKEPG